MQAYSCCNPSKCSWWLSHGPRTNLLTQKLVVGSDDTSPFGAKKAYFRGSFCMSHTKKVKLWKMDSHHLFKQLKKHPGWLFPAVQGQFQGHPSCFSAWRFFCWSFFGGQRTRSLEQQAGNKDSELGGGVGGDVFSGRCLGQRQPDEKISLPLYMQCPGKTIGISGHYLIGNWFLGVTI